MNHLADSEHTAIRQSLERRREQLADVVAESVHLSCQTPTHEVSEVSDQKSDADRVQQIAVDDAKIQRDLTELAQVNAALSRLDDHQYGLCADCGETIAAGRLKAMPSATRCADCQAAAEKTVRPAA